MPTKTLSADEIVKRIMQSVIDAQRAPFPEEKKNQDDVPPTKRSHMPPAQLRQFKNLMPIFDPKAPISETDVMAQLGAARSKQGDIGLFRTRSNAFGLQYQENLTPEQQKKAPFEMQLFREAGIDPAQAKGKILIGPDATSGERDSTIPHELGHKGGTDEIGARLLDILNGRSVADGKAMLRQMLPKMGFEELVRLYAPILAGDMRDAAKELTDIREGKKKANATGD